MTPSWSRSILSKTPAAAPPAGLTTVRAEGLFGVTKTGGATRGGNCGASCCGASFCGNKGALAVSGAPPASVGDAASRARSSSSSWWRCMPFALRVFLSFLAVWPPRKQKKRRARPSSTPRPARTHMSQGLPDFAADAGVAAASNAPAFISSGTMAHEKFLPMVAAATALPATRVGKSQPQLMQSLCFPTGCSTLVLSCQ
mmetsp:Transcript_97938/g.272499  ORF Transcript_97938/g.272499 Transcript_97938/m.272499 type:complete len:200 (+) Transcript_97938:453-1052(+)